MKNLSQEESNKHWARLKSLDEPSNKQIANKEQLDAIMDELYKTSKTYNHNQKILKTLQTQNKKESLFVKILKKLAKLSIFCLKCIAYFIIGTILIYLILKIGG